MVLDLVEEAAGETVPDADCEVFAARDDFLGVEGEVEDAGGMAVEAAGGFEGGHGPDDEGVVGGAGDHDLVVVLQAEDGGAVPVFGDVVDVCGRVVVVAHVADLMLHFGGEVVVGWVAATVFFRGVGAAYHAGASFRVEVPDADGLVA